MFKKYTFSQNLLVFLIIFGAIALAAFPYLVGFFMAGKDYFLGGSHLDQGDVSVYISYIEQVKAGKILAANLFTSETQKDAYFTPFWLSLGLIARVFKLSSVFIYHLARVLAGFIFLYFIFYYFLDLFFQKYREKIIALILICFSSGLGIFYEPFISGGWSLKNFPADLWISEANTFLTLSHSGLFIVAQFLIILAFYLALKENIKRGIPAALFGIGLILGFIHTYELFIVAGVLFAYFILNLLLRQLKLIADLKGYIWKCFFLGLGFLPAIIYFYFIVRKEPALWGWIAQNITPAPPFTMYLIAFGTLILFSLISSYLLRKQVPKNLFFLITWSVTLLFLVYLPVAFQRRLNSTLHIALAILAAYSIFYFGQRLPAGYKKKNKIILASIFFVFLGLSNLSYIYTVIYSYHNQPPYFYFPDKYYQAALWLKAKAEPQGAVLAGVINSRILPALIIRPVFICNAHQTLGYNRKLSLAEDWFFKDNNQDAAKKEFLQKYNIKYIFYTERERDLGSDNLDKKDFLEKIYEADETIIYQVK